jgi:hypothetical protein
MGLLSLFAILIPVLLILAALFSLRYRLWPVFNRRALVPVWGAALLITLGVLLLPSYRLVENFTSPFAEPFHSMFAFTIYLLPLLAWLLASVLLAYGVAGMRAQANAPGGWQAITSLILSVLLFASSFYNLYWQFVWDQTTDGFYVLLLAAPIITVMMAGVLLTSTLQGREQWYGLAYTLFLGAALFTTFSLAIRVDYHQLTEARAGWVSQAIERYYVREGHYPATLTQLVPVARLLLPGPVIIPGQDWCYQSGEGYYRLGYVSRNNWSSPYLYIRTYQQVGAVPEIPTLCAEETEAMIARSRFLRVIGE